MTASFKPVDEAARSRVRHDLDATLMVDAGAGTGKTTLLLERLLNLLLVRKVPLSRVAAVTFTDKAAGELLERLRRALRERSRGTTSDAALFKVLFDDLDRADVGTFHSFCSRILREYPVEARIDPRFRTLDEVEHRMAETEAWEGWLGKSLEKGMEGENAPFARALGLGVTLGQIAKLKDSLLRHWSLMAPPVAIPLPDEDAFRKEVEILLSGIVARLPRCKHPQTDAFMPAFLDFQKRWKEAAGKSGESFALGMSEMDVPKMSQKGRAPDWEGKALAEQKEDFKRIHERFASYREQVGDWAYSGLTQWLAGYFESWRKTRDERGVLSFDDLLGRTRDLLRDHLEARRALRNKWDYLFVDEFQDTDPLQAEILFYLASEDGGEAESKDWRTLKLSPGKLFLVGDPHQSIYRFRRADVDLYEEVKALVASSPGGRVEVLNQNFRTVKPIVDFITARFSPLWPGGAFTAQAAARGESSPLATPPGTAKGEASIPPLVGVCVAAPQDGAHWDVEEKRTSEARAVASFLKTKLLEGSWVIEDPRTKGAYRSVRPGDVAILLRNVSNHEEPYLEALREQGLQFQLLKGRKFYNRPEVDTLVALLSALESPAESARVVAVLRNQVFGFTDEELFLYRVGGGEFRYLSETPSGNASLDQLGRAFALLKDLHDRSRRLPLPETLQVVLQTTALIPLLWTQPQGDQRVANLMKLVQMARDLEFERPLSFGAFVRWIHRQVEDEASEGEASPGEAQEDRLTLMTIHQAKGLEFPVVVVAGTTVNRSARSGSFYFRRKSGHAEWKAEDLETSGYAGEKSAESARQEAEETRLLYVAATRARDSLILPLADWTDDKMFLFPIAPAYSAPEDSADFPGRAVFPVEPSKGAAEVTETLRADLLRAVESPEVLKRAEETEAHFAGRAKRLLKRIRPLERSRASDHEELEEAQAPEMASEAEGPGGRAFGTLAHRLMERAWDWDGALLEKAALFWGAQGGLPVAEVREALAWVERAVTSELGRRIARSPVVFREVPASFLRDGVLNEGVADLVFEEDGEWVLVDYKTDRDPGDRAAAYDIQMVFYAGLLKATTGRGVKEAWLLNLRTGETREVVLTV